MLPPSLSFPPSDSPPSPSPPPPRFARAAVLLFGGTPVPLAWKVRAVDDFVVVVALLAAGTGPGADCIAMGPLASDEETLCGTVAADMVVVVAEVVACVLILCKPEFILSLVLIRLEARTTMVVKSTTKNSVVFL